MNFLHTLLGNLQDTHVILIRCILIDNNKNFPQILLDKCLYQISKNTFCMYAYWIILQ